MNIDYTAGLALATRAAAPLYAGILTDYSSNDSEEEAWNSIIKWLGRLRTLEGVPFPYIVPHEEMLPNDSIRFFHIDRNWIDAMIDGALSTGVLDSRGSLADVDPEKRAELYVTLMEALNEQELILNPFRTALAAHDKARALNKDVFDSVISQANQNYTTRIQSEIARIPEQHRAMKEDIVEFSEERASSTPKTSPKDGTAQTYGKTNNTYLAGKAGETPAKAAAKSVGSSLIQDNDFGKKQIEINKDIQAELAQQISGILSQMTMIRGGLLTGFLMRSTIVRDYPGLEIRAYDAPECVGKNREKGFDEGRAIQALRITRLSETILLCIFNGVPTHLRMKEPSEGIRLGLEKQDLGDGKISPKLFVKYKDRNGVIHDQISIDVSMRAGTGDASVLRMSDFMNPNSNGKTWDDEINHLIPDSIASILSPNLTKGGYVATQLMQFPYQQDFSYDSIRQQPIMNSQKEAVVNVQAIRVEDSSVVNRPDNGGE